MVRQKHANDTLGRMRSIVPIMPVINEPSDGPDPPEPSYTCARWDAIAQYLFDHRDPDDLCLDTLDFPMPEQTLYKNVYYNGKGMPGITPDEFRDFLRVCHQRKLLFRYIIRSVAIASLNFHAYQLANTYQATLHSQLVGHFAAYLQAGHRRKTSSFCVRNALIHDRSACWIL